MKNITHFLCFLVLTLFFNTSLFCQTTYTFTDAGNDSSGNNSGHKTITTTPTNANIEISDNMTYTSNLFYPDASGDVTVTFTLKGDGLNVGSFDVTDMNWGNFTGTATLDESITKIVFTKTDLTTVTWDSFKPAFQAVGSFTTANHSVLDIFTAGATVTNVSEIEITVDFVGGGSTQNFELRDITLNNLTAPVLCADPDVPTVTSASSTVCSGNSTTLNISGNLNDATQWAVYTGTCGGTLVGTTATSSISVTPTAPNTTYFVRGEGGCVTPGSCASVSVNVSSVSAISTINDVSCNGGSDGSINVSASNGVSPYNYSLDLSGTPIYTNVSSNSLTGLSAGTYTLTVEDSNGCTFSESITVTEPVLEDASFNYSAASYCTDSSDPTPAITGLTGGTFSSTAGLSINVSTGTIDVSASTPSTYTVTYATAGACSNSSNVTVTINALDNASFNYNSTNYCVDASDPTPTITGLTGGTFSSTAGLSINAGTGTIDVSASTPNSYIVSYTTTGSCPNTSNVIVTINALDDPSFNYSAPNYCVNAADPIPTVTGLAGGTFSSTAGLSINASNGTIDVSLSTPGTYTVTYTTAGNCPNASNASVTINGLDDPSFSYSAASYASSDSDPTATITGVAGGAFSSASGLSLNTSTGTIDVSTSIPDTYIITYTTTGTCPNSSTVSVTITGTFTWEGNTDNDWNTISNWNYNAIPLTNSDIVIPSGLTNYPTASSAVTFTSLTINSGASFIPQSTVTGAVTYNRTLPTTNWYLVSAPVEGETLEDIIANHTLASGTGGNLGFAPYSNITGPAWLYAQSGSTGALNSGSGHSVKLVTPGDLSFTGTMNTSNVNRAINVGSRTSYNLVGNPFTAYINSASFATANTALLTEETIWLWNGSTYIAYNAVSPIEVAPGQGFFIEANANGNVTFATSNQSHSTETFMRSSIKTNVELFVENTGIKTSTKVFYVPGKTTGFDQGYDSKIFDGVKTDFEIFSELVTDNNGQKLAIQTLPNSDFETTIVPIGIIAEAGKALTFSIRSARLPNAIDVYLEDRINGQFFNLSEGKYTTTLKQAATGTGQFYLHTTSQRLGSEDISGAFKTISIYKSSNEEITIAGLQGDATVSVYSVLGTQILQQSITSNGSSRVNLPVLSKGVYIVKLSSDLGELTKKIVLKN